MTTSDTLTPFGFYELPVEQAHARLSDFFVIDVRETEELHGELSHIPGVHHVPLADLPRRSEEFPTDRPLLLVCRSGARSASACAWLRQRGFPAPSNLSGGMIAWNDAGFTVAPR